MSLLKADLPPFGEVALCWAVGCLDTKLRGPSGAVTCSQMEQVLFTPALLMEQLLYHKT